MADNIPQPAQIAPEPIQPAPQPTAELTITPEPTPAAAVQTPEPTPIAVATPEPIFAQTSAPTPLAMEAQIIPTVTTPETASITDKVTNFKLYIIIFTSVIGLATVGYVTYSFFFSGSSQTKTETTPPPSVVSPFNNDNTQTTSITPEKTSQDSTPPSLGGGKSDFGKTVQDLKDASTGTDKVYDNAILEETTPTSTDTTKKIHR